MNITTESHTMTTRQQRMKIMTDTSEYLRVHGHAFKGAFVRKVSLKDWVSASATFPIFSKDPPIDVVKDDVLGTMDKLSRVASKSYGALVFAS